MKKAARRPLSSKMVRKTEPSSQTLLREACACGGTLAGLEFRVGFADHVNRALAFHNLAISVTALGGGEGRKNFHGVKWWESCRLLVATGARKLAIRSTL